MTDDKAWIETVTGGTVTRFERSASGRSRGTWLVDVDRPGCETLALVLRRDTGDGPLSGTEINLSREAQVYRALADTGVLIPKIWAITDDGDALLVDRVPGTDDIGALTDQADRERLAASFIEALGALHNVDVAGLDIPALDRPARPEDHALADLAVWKRVFEGHVSRPAPWVRYAFDWLERYAPPASERTVLCHGDVGPGNFMYSGTEVTSILDWEFAHFGDPMDDLAWLSIRGGQFSQFGDLTRMLTEYARITGLKVDPDRVRYYQVFVLVRMAVACLVALDGRGGNMDAATYFNLGPALAVMVTPILAERLAVTLDPVEPAAGNETPDAEVIDALFSDLTTVLMPALTDKAAKDRAGGMASLLIHLRAADRVGPAVADAELDDLTGLLGQRPATVSEGMRLLDERLAAGGFDREDELIRYFGRAARRQVELWPAVGIVAGSPIQPVTVA
jgi:aminoglycoside phosphotransferase (APT) family kinase protein